MRKKCDAVESNSSPKPASETTEKSFKRSCLRGPGFRGREKEDAVHIGQLWDEGANRLDDLDHDRAGSRAVASPQLHAMDPIVGGEIGYPIDVDERGRIKERRGASGVDVFQKVRSQRRNKARFQCLEA